MKIEKINGVDTVVMADNETLHVTKENDKNKHLKINDKLESELINKEDLLSKCDEWLDYFKKIHDIMLELVSNKDFENNELSMYLYIETSKYPTTCVNDLQLLLVNEGTHILYTEGIRESTQNNNIYKYLFVSVINYIMQQDYATSMQFSDDGQYKRWIVKRDNDRLNPSTIVVLRENDTEYLSEIMTELNDSYQNNTEVDTIIEKYREPLINKVYSDDADLVFDNVDRAELRYEKLLKIKEEHIGQQRKRNPETK